jgi:hypothetical protein
MRSVMINTEGSIAEKYNLIRFDLRAAWLRLLEYGKAPPMWRWLACLKMFGNAFCERTNE